MTQRNPSDEARPFVVTNLHAAERARPFHDADAGATADLETDPQPQTGADTEISRDAGDEDHDYGDWAARFRRRDRKRKATHDKAQRERAQFLESRELVTPEGGTPGDPDSAFVTTYHPGRFEEGWLMQSIRPFYEDGLIVDVLAQIKGGKEANVYLCQANPETGLDLLAAKVYRPRKFRNLRNDAVYREGREILSSEGGVVKRRDSRSMRAMKQKTSLGVKLLHQSWILYEYGTLQQLHERGARVPRPVASGDNAILMEFIGDRRTAAPILHAVRLSREDAERLFTVTMENVELMLTEGWIHGDLSSFNILYWEGEITLIDFPQVTVAHKNHNGFAIFQRDVLRVCQYFQKQGVRCDPEALAESLWREHAGEDPFGGLGGPMEP